jgi:hypothetical protein
VNLRKDHCRNLHSRTTRERVKTTAGRPRPVIRGSARRPPHGGQAFALPAKQRTPARTAPRNMNERASPRSPVRGRDRGVASSSKETERLSTTDISALASMKNVVKCDTWCELQNPVNHRVFERKLRPKPSGRGHVCLGVSHRVAPPHAPRALSGGGQWPPVRRRLAVGPKNESPATTDVTTSGGREIIFFACCRAIERRRRRAPATLTRRLDGASTATPGQAGLPAEFKHINKRRKRNLQGFP